MAVTYTMSYARFPDPMDAKLWSKFWVLGHLWSLSVEEQFYLVWPFALVSAFRFRKTLAIAAIILAAISRAVLPHYMNADMDYFPPCLADSLASGCLLAIWRPRLPQWMLHPASLLSFSTASLLLALRFHHSVALPKYLGGTIPLMIALCIWIAVLRRDWILNNAFVSALGVISYSLYLWQQPFLDRSSHHWWNAFPINIMLALACAYLSYRFVEKPMLRFKMTRQPASQKTLEGLQEEAV
jgi:peptidoglycan/LPS O-acetylase OafA/YrhL